MQRNLRSEIMVAFGAVMIIGFGLVFAILLTGSGEEGEGTAVVDVSSPSPQRTGERPTLTPSTEAGSETESSTETLTEEATATEAATQAEPSPTEEARAPEPTETEEEPSEDATETEEATQLEPSDEATATRQASVSNEPTASQEATEREPSRQASATEQINATEAASSTLRSTGRATRAATASDEPEPSATNTVRPSSTPTNSPSPTRTTRPSTTPSPTVTLRPSSTPTSQNAVTGIIPTPPPSPTVPPLNAPSRTPSSCQLPQGWTTYTVQAGNTLFAIALATNSTVDELRSANCIENIDNIQTGDVVYVPRAPLNPVATFVNTGSRAGLRPIGCQNPSVQITSPITAQRINGTFTVYGSANRSDFLYYKIEVRPDAASIYNFYSDSRTQVTNGVLGEINSELFGSGLHWIKLTVVDLSASIPADASCEIPVIFE